MSYYDTNTQDMPLRDISSTRVKAYSEFQYYPTMDENDPDMIFIQGIDLSGVEDSTSGNVEILRDDQRVKHIRVRGSPVEAMASMNEIDGL